MNRVALSDPLVGDRTAGADLGRKARRMSKSTLGRRRRQHRLLKVALKHHLISLTSPNQSFRFIQNGFPGPPVASRPQQLELPRQAEGSRPHLLARASQPRPAAQLQGKIIIHYCDTYDPEHIHALHRRHHDKPTPMTICPSVMAWHGSASNHHQSHVRKATQPGSWRALDNAMTLTDRCRPRYDTTDTVAAQPDSSRQWAFTLPRLQPTEHIPTLSTTANSPGSSSSSSRRSRSHSRPLFADLHIESTSCATTVLRRCQLQGCRHRGPQVRQGCRSHHQERQAGLFGHQGHQEHHHHQEGWWTPHCRCRLQRRRQEGLPCRLDQGYVFTITIPHHHHMQRITRSRTTGSITPRRIGTGGTRCIALEPTGSIIYHDSFSLKVWA